MAAATKTSLSNRTLHAIILCWSRCKKTGEVYFCLLATKGLHAKVKNERFNAAGWRRQSIKCEHFTSSFSRLRQNKNSEPMNIQQRLPTYHTKLKHWGALHYHNVKQWQSMTVFT